MEKATTYGLLAVLLWSTVATAFKFALISHTPAQVLLWSVSVSVVTLWSIVALSKKFRIVIPTLIANWQVLCLIALINPTIYYLVLFEAYDRLPAQLAQPINYTWAIMLALLSVPVLKQKLTKYDCVGGLLGYFGVLIIASQGQFSWSSQANFLGISLAFFSTVLWAIYWLLNTKLSGDSIVMMALSFTIALPLITCWVVAGDGLFIDPNALGSLIWIGIFEMGVTFVLWQRALDLTKSVAKVGNLIFLSPFISLVFIWYFLGEAIKLSTVFGLLFIIVGVGYQQRKTDVKKISKHT